MTRAIAYPHIRPDLWCLLRLVSMCVHTLGSIWSITGTMCTQRELHHHHGCPQHAGLSPSVQPVKLHAEIKAFSLSEQRKMMAGGCYCKWGFETKFKNQPNKKPTNLNDRQERAFGAREKWCAPARLAFWEACACSLFRILFAETMKKRADSLIPIACACDLGGLLWNPSPAWLSQGLNLWGPVRAVSQPVCPPTRPVGSERLILVFPSESVLFFVWKRLKGLGRE